MNSRTTILLRTGLLFFTALLLSCGDSSDHKSNIPVQTTLEQIKENGRLDVLTRNAPTTYYQVKNTLVGMEYDLLNSFADSIGVSLNLITKENTADILSSLDNGDANLAAAGLTQTQSRAQKFSFGPVYQQVEQQLVCRRGTKIPKSIEGLVDVELWIAAATSYSDSLMSLKKVMPDLVWYETTEFDTEQLLEQVWLKEIGCTIADSNIVSINRRYYPELVIAFNISPKESLSWILPTVDQDFQNALNRWFKSYKESGELAATIDRYYGFVDLFDYVDLQSFKRRLTKRLPKYKKTFQNAAQKYEQSWTLLAAQSYQESHWRNRAKSPTGVRGMMMLTLNTAKELGIKNRINAKNSIFGGAQYMQKLRKRVPEEIDEPDRTWFALAAYNVGMGHIHDARTLALSLGKDPNKWNVLADVLPLLSQKKYYKKLKYGYARGSEPVHYVRRIRDYHDILERELMPSDIEVAGVSAHLEKSQDLDSQKTLLD